MYEELYSFVVIINVNYLLLKDNNKYQAVDKCKICMSQQPIFNEEKC